MNRRYGFYEFFAGGGMARLGLGKRWKCLMANDICSKKAESYLRNFPGTPDFIADDIRNIDIEQLPGHATLSWASFPCQDLSLAGSRRGLNGNRSSTFWPFWSLMQKLKSQGRPVPIIVLENVVGAISSNDGRDFLALFNEITGSGYKFGPLVMDASFFVPQSRPRLFIIAVHDEINIPENLKSLFPVDIWHTKGLVKARERLSSELKNKWVWWNLPVPQKRKMHLDDIIEMAPDGVEWRTEQETRKLLSLMTDTNLMKVNKAQLKKKRVLGTIYKRTRKDGNGIKRQRAEVRFDRTSGCLRTPAGGSSRQIIIMVEGEDIKTRLLSPREAARLMGVYDNYILPPGYNEAYHLMGDGLVVPVIEWLDKNILHPIAQMTSEPVEIVS